MDKEEYQQLSYLLRKLARVVKRRFCIIPEHIQDLCYIATFDSDGNKLKEVNGLDIEDAVNKLTNG